jgi:crotonobetainyl-CoA:carnitine CoA-transferase CaiB-like acyl-CoA transferase
MDSMMAVMQSFSFWNLAKTTFLSAGRAGNVGVSGLHKTKDGYVMFSLPAGRITDWFKEMLDVEELEPEIIESWVSEKTMKEVVDTLVETGIPVGAVQDLDEAQTSPQAVAREMFVKVDHPILGEIIEPGFPIKFSDTKGDVTKPAPLLGEHTEDVLKNVLGLSDEEIMSLRKEGVV